MPVPVTAKAFEQALDPSDIVDFYVFISQGSPDASPPTVLLKGEAVAAYSLALSPEAAAVGLRIVERGSYKNSFSGNLLTVYFEVDDDLKGSPLFSGIGITVAVEMTIVTTSIPPRTKQRSFLVRIANQ